MTRRLILNVLANNRVGIVAALSNALAELSGDLLEISQSVVQNYFSATVAVEFPAKHSKQLILDHLRDACRAFQAEFTVREMEPADCSAVNSPAVERYLLMVTGEDKPGMLRYLSSCMAMEGIDIADLYATRNDATNRFVIAMELDIPDSISISCLEEELQDWAVSVDAHMLLHQRDVIYNDHPFPHTREARYLASPERTA